MAAYVPDRGDVVWLSMDPPAGREQAGMRPAIVLSPLDYNQKVGLALFCPITSQIKNYPFEVRIPEGFAVRGVILSDQIKNLDWKSRRADYICKLPAPLLHQALSKLGALLNPKNG